MAQGKIELESMADKEKEAGAMDREAIPEPRQERSGEPVHWLVPMKEKISQKFNTYLAAMVVVMVGLSLLTLVLTALWVAPVIASQNEKIASIEAQLALHEEMEAKDKALELTQQNLSQLERNLMRANEKISELETQVSDMDETVREKISELETQVSDMDETVREKISELETQVSDMDETVREKISELETQVSDMDETVRANDEAMQTALAGIGRAYNGTVERVSALERAQVEIETGLRHTREGLTNTTLAVESMAGQLQNLAVELSDTTARTESVAAGLDSVRSDIDTLNATKATWQALEDSTARLDRDKVDRGEFEGLSANLTSLAEASSNEDDVIRQELSELADSSLNQTHYDTLHQTIQQLDSSKASQTDLEALATEVEVLANSTVRTTTFHQQVENIESTTSQLQYNINQLRLNITSIDGRVRQITVTLATKADQASLDRLSDTVESLEQTFQELEGTVRNLETSKADESDLSSLRGTVNSLRGTAAKESDLNDLEQNLRDHTSSSAQTHSVFTSDIRSNEGDIGSNTGRIEQLESSSSGLTASWVAVSMSVILVTVFLTIHTY